MDVLFEMYFSAIPLRCSYTHDFYFSRRHLSTVFFTHILQKNPLRPLARMAARSHRRALVCKLPSNRHQCGRRRKVQSRGPRSLREAIYSTHGQKLADLRASLFLFGFILHGRISIRLDSFQERWMQCSRVHFIYFRPGPFHLFQALLVCLVFSSSFS